MSSTKGSCRTRPHKQNLTPLGEIRICANAIRVQAGVLNKTLECSVKRGQLTGFCFAVVRSRKLGRTDAIERVARAPLLDEGCLAVRSATTTDAENLLLAVQPGTSGLAGQDRP